MKKLFALILTVAMLLSLAVAVSAEEETGNLSITRGDDTEYYDSIADVVEYAQDGDVIKVERDYTERYDSVYYENDDTPIRSVTLELNGKEIHTPEGLYYEDHGMWDIYGLNITFTDTVGGGVIHALVTLSGDAVIKGGTFLGFWSWGRVTIEGGTFLGMPQEIVDEMMGLNPFYATIVGTKGLLLTGLETEDEARAALDAIIADGCVADKPYEITPYEMDGETRYSAGFAAGTTVSKSNDYNTNVTYSVAPTFTVTIPASVTLGEDATISAENVVVPKGKQVEVSIADANGFKATTPEGAELIYTVKNGEDAVAEGETVLAVNPKDGKTGSTTLSFVAPETIQYAGTYTGTVTFTVAVKDASKPIINFTIDGASYQAEEGMTWSEWVESASNTIGLYLSDSADGVYWDWYCLFDATGAVKASDVIEAEAYTLIQTES